MNSRVITAITFFVLFSLSPIWAEVPQTMNYQGRLTNNPSETTVTASVSMTFTIYDTETDGNSKWTETHPAVAVVDGLFNVILGAGTPAVPVEDTVFSGADRWLEITIGGETIIPRTKLGSNAYAFQSNWNRVGDVLFTSGEWGVGRAGSVLYGYDVSTHVNLGVACTTGADGQTRNYVTVSGGYENTASGNYSTVGGGEVNTASYLNATVGGGSYNTASYLSSTVGGGEGNIASGLAATVSGGEDNQASGSYSFIGGGAFNKASIDYSTIGGGINNTASGGYGATVGGGWGDTASGNFSTVSGGYGNTATGSHSIIPGGYGCDASGHYSFAAGRRAKAIHDGSFVWADQNDADFSSTAIEQFLIRAAGGVGIGTDSPATELDVNGAVTATTYYGDGSNLTGITASSDGDWTISGDVLFTSSEWGLARDGNILYGQHDSTHVNLGVACTTGTNGGHYRYSTVSGGYINKAAGNSSTVGGGRLNKANGDNATVSGGYKNKADGFESTVGGGYENLASNYYSTVGGGNHNIASGEESTIGGGKINEASNHHATVGGGYGNTAGNQYSTVGGGQLNTADGYQSTIGGGDGNTASGGLSVVSGGDGNTASSYASVIGGGWLNTASDDYSTVGGGYFNAASGEYSTVGGGKEHTASGYYSVVPGGYANNASGNYSFAAGRRAKANNEGAFVWADSDDADFESTGDNQFLVRASGGVGIGTANPQGALDVSSTTGAFIVPRMTTVERNALAAVNGMIIYNTTVNRFNFYEAGAWVAK